MTPWVLDLHEAHVGQLDANQLEELVRKLCEADLVAQGLSTRYLACGGEMETPEDGIDCLVELPAETQMRLNVPRSVSGYQCKATGMKPADCKKEMHQKKKPKQKESEVRESIKGLIGENGAYVIVGSRDNCTPKMRTARIAEMRKAVAGESGSAGLHLDFIDQSELAKWIRQNAGVVVWVWQQLGTPVSLWKPFENWSKRDVGVEEGYLFDDQPRVRHHGKSGPVDLIIQAAITRIRSELSQAGKLVRIVGISGSGKTRLLPALFDERLGQDALPKQHVVYGDAGLKLEPEPVKLLSQLIAAKRPAILLVDNCERSLHKDLKDELSGSGVDVRVVSVDLDISDHKPEDTEVFRLSPPEPALTAELLRRRYPNLSSETTKKIAEFAGGNTRLALLVAVNLGSANVSLAGLTNQDIFERLFYQGGDKDDTLLRAAEALALVYSFDIDGFVEEGSELDALERITCIGRRKLYRHADRLQERELVQARGTMRAVLPQPLADRLACQGLRALGGFQLADLFVQKAPSRLLRSFMHRLGYLHLCDAARQIVRTWFARDGYLGAVNNLGATGQYHFYLVAPVDPEAALAALERIDTSMEGENHPQHWCELISKLAYDAALFDRAVALLLRISVVADAGNAEERIQALFQFQLSATQATGTQRRELIDRWFRDPDLLVQQKTLHALGSMLGEHWGYFDPDLGAWYRTNEWTPTTDDDAAAWYHGAFERLRNIAVGRDDTPLSEEDEWLIREDARDTLSGLIPMIWRKSDLWKDIDATLREIASDNFQPRVWMALRDVTLVEHPDANETRSEALKALEAELAPTNLSDRAEALLLGNRDGDCFNLQDHRIGDDEQAIRELDERYRELGRELAAAPQTLAQAATKFADTPNASIAEHGKPFSQGLREGGTSAKDTWDTLVFSLREARAESPNAELVLWFFDRFVETDSQGAETVLDTAINDPLLGRLLPTLQQKAGISGAGLDRLLSSTRAGIAAAVVYHHVFIDVDPTQDGLSKHCEVIRTVSDLENGMGSALRILANMGRNPRSPITKWSSELRRTARHLLLNCNLSPPIETNARALERVSQLAVSDADEDFVRRFSERLRDTIYAPRFEGRRNGTYRLLLGLLLCKHPRAALDVFSAELPEKAESYRRRVFSGGVGLSELDLEDLADWLRIDPQNRAERLADAAVIDLVHIGANSFFCAFYRTLLDAAPDPAPVFGKMTGALSHLWGRSGHAKKRTLLIDCFSKYQNEAVQSNLNTLVELLDEEHQRDAETQRQLQQRFEP